jgi:DNA primase large subunit
MERKYLGSKKDAFSRITMNQRDQISHFILRLAYCKTEELRRWFLDKEAALFKYRLESSFDSDRQEFMLKNGIQFEILTEEEKQAKAAKLIGLTGIKTPGQLFGTNFYK